MVDEDLTHEVVLDPSQAPDWEPVTGLQNTMTITGKLQLSNGDFATDPNILVAGFKGDECRGLASPTPHDNPVQDGIIYLSIGSNESSGEMITFQAYLPEEDIVVDLDQELEFIANIGYGSIADPFVFTIDAEEEMSLTLNFLDGFTWFSVNLDPGSMLADDLFADLEPAANDRILGQTESAIYTGEQWFENIEIDPKQRYVMDLSGSQSIVIEGDAVPVEPVHLFGGDPEGYTWLGYLPQSCMDVNQALDISPAPAEGDRILMPGAFSQYSEAVGWAGDLTDLCPGEGYTIAMGEDAVLSYPGTSRDAEVADLPGPTHSPAGLHPPRNMRHTMTVMAQLELPGGEISINEEDMVYALVGNECRGMASLMLPLTAAF